MAYRKSKGKLARRSKKIQPAVQTMWFSMSVPAESSETFYLDLSQCASLVNRRFYRQGINWAVESFEVFTENTAAGKVPQGVVACSKLPQTWVMSNAWEKSFRSWQEMNDKALEDTESIRPKFMDFKVYADSVHHQKGFAANLLPISLGGPAVAGEWDSSKISVPTSGTTGVSTDFELVAVGASYPGASPVTTLDAVSLIEGYAASRGLPYTPDPNVPDDAADVGPTATPENWMGALTNEGTDQDKEVLDRMVGTDAENNQAPYPFENGRNPAGGFFTDTHYPNGANQLTGLEVSDYAYITQTVIGGENRLRGGLFPCGLVRFDISNTEVADPGSTANMGVILGVRLVPGHHRGYLCEPMTEM